MARRSANASKVFFFRFPPETTPRAAVANGRSRATTGENKLRFPTESQKNCVFYPLKEPILRVKKTEHSPTFLSQSVLIYCLPFFPRFRVKHNYYGQDASSSDVDTYSATDDSFTVTSQSTTVMSLLTITVEVRTLSFCSCCCRNVLRITQQLTTVIKYLRTTLLSVSN